jgi:hypothetical protein
MMIALSDIWRRPVHKRFQDNYTAKPATISQPLDVPESASNVAGYLTAGMQKNKMK